MTIDEILKQASVIPVLEVEALENAAPLAKALAAGGLKVVELTLRTECAPDAIAAMKEAEPSLLVGAGTVRTKADIARAKDAGAAFLVTPGAPPDLLAALGGSNIPALPGVATASEVMTARAAGFRILKFFPAVAAGGTLWLKTVAGPFPDLWFCPTGGISAEEATDYLALSNVICVGGSWIATRAMVASGRWDEIEANARRAAKLRG